MLLGSAFGDMHEQLVRLQQHAAFDGLGGDHKMGVVDKIAECNCLMLWVCPAGVSGSIAMLFLCKIHVWVAHADEVRLRAEL